VTRVVVLPAFAFVVLGLPAGALGVAWPAMREDFGAPLASLAVLIAAFTATYFLAATLIARLAAKLGMRGLLVASAGSAAVGLGFVGLADSLALAIVGMLVFGVGSGGLDAGLNAYVALGRSLRTMGALHASWAAGAAIGPPLVATAVAGESWRWAFVVMALAFVFVGVILVQLRSVAAIGVSPPSPTTALRGRVLLLVLSAFITYVGLEAAAGQWAFTDLAVLRGLDTDRAATGATLFFLALASGRAALAMVGHRVNPERLLNTSLVVTCVACLSYVVLSPTLGALVILPVLGASLSVFVPLVISLTPRRFGPEQATTIVGAQVAAGAVGGVGLPVVVGVAMQSFGAGALGWSLVVGAAILLGANLLAQRILTQAEPTLP
jgi:fucose permease